MNIITRVELKKIFKKVKKLHVPVELELIDFDSLKYYSWPDESSQSLYLVPVEKVLRKRNFRIS